MKTNISDASSVSLDFFSEHNNAILKGRQSRKCKQWI